MWLPGVTGFNWRALVERARSKICGADRVLCGILLSLRLTEAKGLGTLGVTRDGRLFVDPEAVKKFTLGGRRVEELVRILIHEALHVLFLHPERCEKLRDRELCNIAADAIVEAVIEDGLRRDRSLARLLGIYTDSGVRLAPRAGSEYSRGLSAIQELLAECGVEWSEVPSYTLEALYNRLEKCVQGLRVGLRRVAIDAHHWGAGSSHTGVSGGRERLEEVARLATQMARESQKGLSGLTGKLPGTAPGEWERVLEELGLKPKLDWRQVLQRLLERYVPVDYTWRHPSKRSWSLGVYLPGPLRRGWKIAVVLDTSGSISEDEYVEFLSELYQLLQDRPVETIVVAQGDVKLQRVEVFTDPPPPSVINWARRRRGYGGTDFASVLEELLSKHPDLDLIIYFTDGYGRYPSAPPGPPIVWVLSREGAKPGTRFWPPYGHVVRIE